MHKEISYINEYDSQNVHGIFFNNEEKYLKNLIHDIGIIVQDYQI